MITIATNKDGDLDQTHAYYVSSWFPMGFHENHHLLAALSQLTIHLMDDMLYLKVEAMLPLIQLS